MTHEQKITYMRISASLCNFGFKEEQLDLLVSIYENVVEKKGNGTIKDIVRIEREVKDRAIAREVKEKESQKIS